MRSWDSAPARRPIQVTQDLKGFWDRTYAEVRKKLKGRYPKRPWPGPVTIFSITHKRIRIC